VPTFLTFDPEKVREHYEELYAEGKSFASEADHSATSIAS
jgi:hypothetical protein